MVFYIFLIFAMAIISGSILTSNSYYQMAVLVISDDESEPGWPNKKEWFDASKWLKDSQYIKINDFFVLNRKFKEIPKLNDFLITIPVQEAIKESVNSEPDLLYLSKLDDQDFFLQMKDKLSYEYLRTEFNDETLQPTNDYFLVFFIYKGILYELEVLRTIYKNDFVFNAYSFVHKAGYWHSIYPAEFHIKILKKAGP